MLKNVSWPCLQSICPDLHQGLGPSLHYSLFPQPSFPQSTLASFSYFDTMLFASGPLHKLFPLLKAGSVHLSWSSTCQLLFIFQVSTQMIQPLGCLCVLPKTPYLLLSHLGHLTLMDDCFVSSPIRLYRNEDSICFGYRYIQCLEPCLAPREHSLNRCWVSVGKEGGREERLTQVT